MAYQNPAFYFYHLGRISTEVLALPASPTPPDEFPVYDSRLGELFKWPSNLTTSKQMRHAINSTTDPNVLLIDTLIVAGQNMGGARINCFTNPGAVDILNPDYFPNVDGSENGKTLLIPLTAAVQGSATYIEVGFSHYNPPNVGSNLIVPEASEIWLTIERVMSRGPQPSWTHSWRRTQKRYESVGGVSSTWQTGPARKTWTLTWRNLHGADRQILLDGQDQTDDWSQPFWFRPPDTTYPTLLVELDRDADWQQDFSDPLIAGTSDKVTMPMIEVLG